MDRTLIAKEEFPSGTMSIAVSLYESGLACEVELWDEDNYPMDVMTLLLSELELARSYQKTVAPSL